MANIVITPSVFAFQHNQVRTTMQSDGTVWFVAKDICAILGITWSGATLKVIPKDWQGMLSFNTPSGTQRLRVINEAATYKLAFRSNKPEADAFTNWVASEVLPSIRKTGGYEARPNKPRIITLEEQMGPHFSQVRLLTRQIFEHEREIYAIIRRGSAPNMYRSDTRRVIMQNMYSVLDSLWSSFEHSVNAIEAHAKSMCAASRL